MALGYAGLTVYRRGTNPGTVGNDEMYPATISVDVSSKKCERNLTVIHERKKML
jgi:hypothetical protein